MELACKWWRHALEGGWMGVLICVLKSQINEHDKLLLLALASPQVAKWHCLTLLWVLGGSPQPFSTPHPFPFPLTWDSPCRHANHSGKRGKGGHSAWGSRSQWAEQRGSQCKWVRSFPLLKSSRLPRQCHPQRTTQEVVTAAAASFPARIYLRCVKPCLRPIRTQRLSGHTVRLPAVSGLGDPAWPVEDGLLWRLLRAGAARDPLRGLRELCLPRR